VEEFLRSDTHASIPLINALKIAPNKDIAGLLISFDCAAAAPVLKTWYDSGEFRGMSALAPFWARHFGMDQMSFEHSWRDAEVGGNGTLPTQSQAG
jgi:hypothetical protein